MVWVCVILSVNVDYVVSIPFIVMYLTGAILAVSVVSILAVVVRMESTADSGLSRFVLTRQESHIEKCDSCCSGVLRNHYYFLFEDSLMTIDLSAGVKHFQKVSGVYLMSIKIGIIAGMTRMLSFTVVSLFITRVILILIPVIFILSLLVGI